MIAGAYVMNLDAANVEVLRPEMARATLKPIHWLIFAPSLSLPAKDINYSGKEHFKNLKQIKSSCQSPPGYIL